VDWLKSVCTDLGLDGVECLHARAEEQGLTAGYRDSFDLVTSRAVSPLRLLAELCLPFVRVGGRFLAMKTTDCDEELSEAMNAIKLLGGKVLPPYDYSIPHTDITHRVVLLEKVSPTPKGYPRRWAKIQKAPL
jgi:16S rRNA (guanine527-N7)-methyltransferase